MNNRKIFGDFFAWTAEFYIFFFPTNIDLNELVLTLNNSWFMPPPPALSQQVCLRRSGMKRRTWRVLLLPSIQLVSTLGK